MNARAKTLAILSLTALTLGRSTPTRASNVGVSLAADLPRIEASIPEWDVCAFVDEFIDKLGVAGAFLPRLCDYEAEATFGVGAAKVKLAGSLQELVLHDSYVSVDGSFEATVELSPMRIEGGRAPVFAPCDRGDFLGCLPLPSGDALEAWLNENAPMLSVDLPAPNRMCVPGLPVLVKNGYWIKGRWISGYWSGWTYHPPRWIPPRWVAPKFEQCRITDWGELPTVTLPEVQTVILDAYPHLIADLGLSVSANGKATVEIPIPYAGLSNAYKNRWVGLELSGGVFFVISLQAKDTGFDAHLSIDEDVHLQLVYDRETGWSQFGEVLNHEIAPSFDPHGEIIARVGVKVGLKAEAKATLGGSSTDGGDSSSDSKDGDSKDGDSKDADGKDADGKDADDGSSSDGEDAGSKGADEGSGNVDIGMDSSPLAGPVTCSSDWMLGGLNTEIGIELAASVGSYFEGAYEIGVEDPAFNIDWVTEFDHAESLSMAGLCEISCESVAGDDDPACGTVELLRLNVTTL